VPVITGVSQLLLLLLLQSTTDNDRRQ